MHACSGHKRLCNPYSWSFLRKLYTAGRGGQFVLDPMAEHVPHIERIHFVKVKNADIWFGVLGSLAERSVVETEHP